MTSAPPPADKQRWCCCVGRQRWCLKTGLQEAGTWPPAQRSQSVYSSSCVLGVSDVLWKEQEQLKRDLLKATVRKCLKVHAKGLRWRAPGTFSFNHHSHLTNVKENSYVIVFMCWRVLPTSVLWEAVPFQTLLTHEMQEAELSWSAVGFFTWCIRGAAGWTSFPTALMTAYSLPVPPQCLCEPVIGLQQLSWKRREQQLFNFGLQVKINSFFGGKE